MNDLNYDSNEEKRKRRRDPRSYQRFTEERKRIRDREREEDHHDRKLEAE